jgi:ABC-type multidrug transport system fused ATPase/permease subunit
MTFFQKLRYLLSTSQKKQLAFLGVLLLIGMLFEMLGLGILIPALGLMLNSDVGKEYPALKPYLEFLGNPTQMQLVIGGMVFLVIVYLIKAGFLAFLSWRQSKFSSELGAELSRRLFNGYLHQSYAFHLERNSAQLLRNIQTEINLFNSVTQAAIALTTEISLLVAVAFMLVFIEPLGASVVITFLALSALIFHRITKNYLLNWGKKRQVNDGFMNQHLLQGLGGVKDVKLLGRENKFVAEYSTHNIARSKILAKQIALMQMPRLYLELLAVVGLAGLVTLMVVQHKSLALLLPTLGIFVASAFRMIPSVNRIMGAVQQIRYAQPVVDLLYSEFKLIRAPVSIPQVYHKIEFADSILIRDVVFKYKSAATNALNGVTISISKGESVGFIGSSGSGKSSLIDVTLGLLTPSNGNILVDGTDINTNLRGWQDEIGYVPQTIYLTDDTLRHNVAFGIPDEEIDEDALRKAIKAAQLDEFVKSLPDGMETFVGERGVRLSGGQRQRIGIARALYHDPPILVLDEATSALDTETENGVMEAVNALHGDKTLLIVAHRLSTVANCDKLYRLDKGLIIEEGIPDKILAARQEITS